MSPNSSPQKSPTVTKNNADFHHDLRPGDHVIRWTRIVIYPIQVHGVVLSAVEDAVTIVDFGISSNDAVAAAGDDGSGKVKDDSHDSDASTTDTIDGEPSAAQSLDESVELEDLVSQKDRDMMKACEKYEGENKMRINIVVITEMNDIMQWKKVSYGESMNKGWKWWWKSDDKDNTGDIPNEAADDNKDIDKYSPKIEQAKFEEGDAIEKLVTDENDYNVNENQPLITLNETYNNREDGSTTIHAQPSLSKAIDAEPSLSTTIHTQPSLSTTIDTQSSLPPPPSSSPPKPSENSKPPKDTQPPKLPSSDPTTLVLSRVHYLLHDPAILPPHNIFYSNSECIAVWCKTGRWSTLQASIFLHSTAAGQFKSAATLATVVGTTTVTQVVPAGGVAGWFGMTTTTTVGLLSLQPWLIPLLAGYGLIAVGVPLFMMRKARVKWEETTEVLTNGFRVWMGDADDDADDFIDTIDSGSKVCG